MHLYVKIEIFIQKYFSFKVLQGTITMQAEFEVQWLNPFENNI